MLLLTCQLACATTLLPLFLFFAQETVRADSFHFSEHTQISNRVFPTVQKCNVRFKLILITQQKRNIIAYCSGWQRIEKGLPFPSFLKCTERFQCVYRISWQSKRLVVELRHSYKLCCCSFKLERLQSKNFKPNESNHIHIVLSTFYPNVILDFHKFSLQS